jgi:DNA-binding PadR family transcriptional regulator
MAGLRRSTELRPEFVALGLLAEGPAHGYELFRRFKASLDGLWHISESQFYATLKRVEKHGLVVRSAPQKGEGASRRLLSLTPTGHKLFAEWITEPTVASPRLVHLEFLTRLYFARRLFPRKVPALVAEQIRFLSTDLARLEQIRENGVVHDEVDTLSADFRVSQLRAALAWLEESVAPKTGR